ncbi:MAG TPA: DUF3800 domain-containing protein [Gemmatimonadaceae bacterium]
MSEAAAGILRYYVDEAGDLTFFDKRGRLLVGCEGVSHCFLVGAARIADPESLTTQLEALRAELLADAYFAGVPSMSRTGGKTALLFHAKDDVPEVRREVFRVLRSAEVEIYAAFRRKNVIANELRARYCRTGEKLGSDFIYDELVTSIFQNRLHQGDENHIVFARRGKSDRNLALSRAIELAKWRFERRWRKGIDRPTTISSSTPSEVAGLQVVDYFLWALQRLIERREERYVGLLAPAYRLVVDRDDTRRRDYGEYYTASSNPITLEKLMPVT